MLNPSPHKAGCKANEPLVAYGLALFCPLCEKRIAFLENDEAEEKITKALENDIAND